MFGAAISAVATSTIQLVATQFRLLEGRVRRALDIAVPKGLEWRNIAADDHNQSFCASPGLDIICIPCLVYLILSHPLAL